MYISIMLIMHYKIISINNSYRDKIMIGYYAYFGFFVIPKLLCVLTFCMFHVVYNSIQKFTIITIIKLLSLS